MPKRDPAFLFYPKDWLEGTAEMLPEEKGVYIDLLCFQHQRGELPSNCIKLSRMVGITEENFNRIWFAISDKFLITGDKMINKKLSELMVERSDKGHKNKISGIFSGILRKKKLTKKQYIKVKNEFNVSDFIEVKTGELSERISEWVNKCLGTRLTPPSKSIEDAIGNETAIGNDLIIKRHELFAAQLLEDEAMINSIGSQTHKDITKQILKQFTAHLHTEGMEKIKYNDFCSHLRNWIIKKPEINNGTSKNSERLYGRITKAEDEKFDETIKRAEQIRAGLQNP